MSKLHKKLLPSITEPPPPPSSPSNTNNNPYTETEHYDDLELSEAEGRFALSQNIRNRAQMLHDADIVIDHRHHHHHPSNTGTTKTDYNYLENGSSSTPSDDDDRDDVLNALRKSSQLVGGMSGGGTTSIGSSARTGLTSRSGISMRGVIDGGGGRRASSSSFDTSLPFHLNSRRYYGEASEEKESYYLSESAKKWRIVMGVFSLLVAFMVVGSRGGKKTGLEMIKTGGGRSSVVAEEGLMEVGTQPVVPVETEEGAKSDPAGSTVVGPEGEVILPPLMEMNYGDTWLSRPESKGPDVPLFWNVPKSGGNAIKFILGKCHGFVMATEAGQAHGDTSALEVFELGGISYVNVDTNSFQGIQRAKSLDLASSGLPDVISTSHLHEMAEIFSNDHKGRIFTVLRHPVDRAVSIYYHQQNVNPSYAGMSITEYFTGGGGIVENNWMTRFLTNKKGGTLTQEDLNLALEVLRRKVLVGLVDEIEDSLRRFKAYFDWKDDWERGEKNTFNCEMQFTKPNVQRNPEVERGSEAWNAIMAQNRFDVQVYSYALHLFGEQRELLETLA